MTRRQLLGTLTSVVVAPFLIPTCAFGQTIAKLDKPLSEWRTLLLRDAYAVLFNEATERPNSSPLNDEKRPGPLHLRGVLSPVVRCGRQIREWHRLAQLFRADRGSTGDQTRLEAHHSPHRVSLCSMWRPSGSHLLGRSASDRPAVVQQWCGPDVRAFRRTTTDIEDMTTAQRASFDQGIGLVVLKAYASGRLRLRTTVFGPTLWNSGYVTAWRVAP